MFIFNLKLSKERIKKIAIWLIISVMAGSALLAVLLLKHSYSKMYVKDALADKNEYSEILPEHYTNILKLSHENIDSYVGKKIKFSGFIYRLSDFSENQFVLAREMIISSNPTQAIIVGFLCENKTKVSYSDGLWVEVEGTIKKRILPLRDSSIKN